MRVHPLAPVLALDIDGTCGRYHDHFAWFLKNIYMPHEFDHPTAWAGDAPIVVGDSVGMGRPQVPSNPDPLDHPEWYIWGNGREPVWLHKYRGEFSEALGMDKRLYRDAKLAYRQGGLKRSMPTFEGEDLRAYVSHWRGSGIQVWIATTRPWQRLDNVDPDTRYWLEHNVGEVDGLVYSENKLEDLQDIVGDRLLGLIDDLPENCEEADRLGVPWLMRRASHNRWWLTDEDYVPNIARLDNTFKDMAETVKTVQIWHEAWKARNG